MRSRSVHAVLGSLLLSTSAAVGANTSPHTEGSAGQLAAAENFIDAFYSFKSSELAPFLSSATDDSRKEISFYQGWAKGAHYKVVRRQACRVEAVDQVACSVTVEDDLMKALRTAFNVTDTFHLSFARGSIAAITTTSDDPPAWEQGKAWVRTNRPELIGEPCRGYFAGGPTPGDCARAMVRGLEEYAVSPDFPAQH